MSLKTPIAVTTIALLFLLSHRTNALSTKAMDASGNPSDIKYIRCETCNSVSRSAAAAINELQPSDLKHLQVLDLVESLCKPTLQHARWMKSTDLVERLGKLRLIPQEGQSDCKRECKTISLACADVLDGIESELADRLYMRRREGETIDEEDLAKWVCAKRGGLSDACRYAPPMLPSDRAPGPSFEPKSQKDVEMENLMESLRASNGGKDLNVNMFNRDQMGTIAEDDDDNEDEDEETGTADAGEPEEDVGEAAPDPDAASLDAELGEADAAALGDLEENPTTVGERNAAGSETSRDEL